MRRRLPVRDERGATLVVVLIFVTVVAVVVTAVLGLADASMRGTLALRDQAAETATAEGAAQVAINTLRTNTYTGATGTTCFTGGSTLSVANVSKATGQPADSASVDCALDTSTSSTVSTVAINSSNKPGNAILALTTSTAEHGLYLKVSGNGALKVKGNVAVKQDIDVDQGSLAMQSGTVVAHSCTGTITSSPAAVCNASSTDARFADPRYPAPTATPTPQTVPSCPGDGKVVNFTPGLYDSGDINDLNNLTKSNGCRDAIFHFTPGTYYFDFPANKPWVINTGYVVGGTFATDFNPNAPSVPGACQSPVPPSDPALARLWRAPGPNAGVQFVFGGTTQIQLKQAQFEICGTYSTNTPPIAVYGLKDAVGVVPAQSGCVITPAGCPAIQSDNSPDSRLYIQGTTYLPLASVDVSLNNLTGQVFRFGVIARSISLNPTGSAVLNNPVIEVPDDSPASVPRTVVELTVSVCERAASCTASAGKVRLRAKVGIDDDPAGSGKRQITVLSWSVLR
jgi:Tfp pilus assembly protein PilX